VRPASTVLACAVDDAVGGETSSDLLRSSGTDRDTGG